MIFLFSLILLTIGVSDAFAFHTSDYGHGSGSRNIDTDGDGINDDVDVCPLQPEIFNGKQDKDGCPDTVRINKIINAKAKVTSGEYSITCNLTNDWFPIFQMTVDYVYYDNSETIRPFTSDVKSNNKAVVLPSEDYEIIVACHAGQYMVDGNILTKTINRITKIPVTPDDIDTSRIIYFVVDNPADDQDGDGIFDDLDMCPDEAEDFNGINDWDGCPEIVPEIGETERISIFARTFIISDGTPVTEVTCNVHVPSTVFRMTVDYVYHDTGRSELHFLSFEDKSDNKTPVSLSDDYEIYVECKSLERVGLLLDIVTKTVKPFHIITIDQTPTVGEDITITCRNDSNISLAANAVSIVQSAKMLALEFSYNSNTASIMYNIPNTEPFLVVCNADPTEIRDLPESDYYYLFMSTGHSSDLTVVEDPEDPDKPKKGNGGCADCIPPTLGLNTNYKRIVDNGFAYNDISVNVEKWHTAYPLINSTVGEMNKVEIIAYENNGISNIKRVQFGLGAEETGQPLSTLEVLIDVQLLTNGTGIFVDKIDITDKDNLIDNDTITAVAYAVTCTDNDHVLRCLKVDLYYSYRESTINNIMVVNVQDKSRNSQNFYFNDGVQVLGESLNIPPIFEMYNKKTNQQTENIWLTLTRTDKINDIWIDQNDVEYHKISDNRYERITPPESYVCNDKPLSEVMVPTRQNCHFRALTTIWDK